MKSTIEGKTVTLPDFLIVGAARSGTTSLHNYLKQHPQIFMPDMKEPQFFAFGEKETHFIHPKCEIIWNFEEFERLFLPAKEGQIAGEASVLYLYLYEETIKSIKKFTNPSDLKIIIILRDPVERTFSMYSHYRLLGEENLDLEEAVDPSTIRERLRKGWGPWFDYLGFGLYYEQVKAYMDNFPRVKVCLYDDLKADAPGLIADIFTFLGVDASFSPHISKFNRAGIARFKRLYSLLEVPNLVSSVFPFIRTLIPLEKRAAMVERLKSTLLKRTEIDERSLRVLKDFFREDIMKLQELIRKDLSCWLE